MIITIDGPSASGKGTLAKRLAEYLGFAHLDTGALYRAVALSLIMQKKDASDVAAAKIAAQTLDFESLGNFDLRDEKIGKIASLVAALPEVRAELLAFQQNFAKNPPRGKAGVVIDGRDIGTVVCPGADIKFFITASPEVRAKRRVLELETRRKPVDPGQILKAVQDRDARDETREISPLKPAQDAHLLDTTNLDIDGAFEKALVILNKTGLFQKL
ncbi:MAG: (d)CMP kinase [Sphingomonadales bacterium]